MTECISCRESDNLCKCSGNQEYGKALASALIAQSIKLPYFVDFVFNLIDVSGSTMWSPDAQFNTDHTIIALALIKSDDWKDMLDLVKGCAKQNLDCSIINEDQTFDQNLEYINKQFDKLNEAKDKLIFGRILSCSHDFIYSGSGNAHPHGNDRCVCHSCGLNIEAGIGGIINKKILNFRDSELLVSKNFGAVPKLVTLSSVQMSALKYPKRFSDDYLADVLKGTPYTPNNVLDLDDENYVWHEDEKYQNYREWYRENISAD